MDAMTAKTEDPEYARRLVKIQKAWWKRAFDVQAPYRWNIRRLQPGYTLDIGCGIGRNLLHLKGNGIGIDHNLEAVEIAKSRGLRAFTPQEFSGSGYDVRHGFDSLLLAHVAEHMTKSEIVDLIERYLPLLKPAGKLILITPQEAGYRSDPTHVEFMDFRALRTISGELGLLPVKEYSFPFPRFFGGVFRYNEFVSVSRKPGGD
jgi:SAM-dependent methyltransferase